MLLRLHFGGALLALSLMCFQCAAILWEPQPAFFNPALEDCSAEKSQQIQNAVTYVNQMAQDTLTEIDFTFANGAVPSTRTGVSSLYQWFFNDQEAKDVPQFRTFLQRILDTGPDAVRVTIHCGDPYARYLITAGFGSSDFKLCLGSNHYAQTTSYRRVNGMVSSSSQPDGIHLYLCDSFFNAPTVTSLPNKNLGDYVGVDNQDQSFMLLHEAFHIVSFSRYANGHLGASVTDPSYGWEGCTFLAEQGVHTNSDNAIKSGLRPIDNADSMALFCQALTTLRDRQSFQWGRNGFAKARNFDWIAANKPLDRYPGNLEDAHRGADGDVEMLPG